MKNLVYTMVAAAVGSLMTLAWLGQPPTRPAWAQEPRPAPLSRLRPAAHEPAPRIPDPAPEAAGAARSPQDLADLTPEERVNVWVYESVNRSVVNITTKSIRSEGFLFEVQAEGAGSGSVLDKAGHVLTNFHVIQEAKVVSATLFDGKTYDAVFVGADPINDVAVIRIDAPPEVLYPVVIGDSARLRVGQRVYAIGNPFGLERTLATGIISSLDRSLQIHGNRTIKQIIQIDAAINPGNSGGPLLDTRGRLIGINTAIASANGQSAGVGFAIPVNLVARIVPQLIAHGKVTRPDVGISRVYQTERGLLVALLVPGGPAERAGIRGPQVTKQRRGLFVVERIDRNAADLIVAVDGQNIKTADDFLNAIETKSPGQQVTLTVIREGREVKVAVRLGQGESESRAAPAPAPGPGPANR